MNKINPTLHILHAENMQRCEIIFKIKQINFNTKKLSTQQKHLTHERVLEVFYLLNSYKENIDIEAGNIHWVAIIGAMGGLFEILLSYPMTAAILTRDFKISVIRLIYHYSGPLKPQLQYVNKLPEMLFSKALQHQDNNYVPPNIYISPQKNMKSKLQNLN